jgi:hypothetical protein
LPSDVPLFQFVASQLHLPSDTREKQMHPPWYASASYGRRPHACILSIHEFSGGLPSLVTLSAPSSWITSRSPSSTGLFPAPLVCPFLEVCMCMHVAVLASWIATNLVPVKMREDSYSIPLLCEILESAHRNHF